MRIPKSLAALSLAVAFTACASAPRRAPAAVSRTQLWERVQSLCLRNPPDPASCAQSDPAHGYVVWKDAKAASHFLLIPSVAVSGIEDPRLPAGSLPNYWAAAWDARAEVSRAVGREVPREALGFAANPPFARSQDQLHIHFDCVKPDVIEQLRGRREGLGTDWGRDRVALHGAEYRIRFIEGTDLGANDPFRILAASLEGSDDRMGNHTLVLVGTGSAGTHDEGFFLLDARRDPSPPGPAVHGEDLLDVGCGK